MNNFKQTGVTLIELMVTVGIVGILTAIALPSYQNSVSKSRRTDAKGVLVSLANAMERCFTEKNSYLDNASDNPNPSLTGCGGGTTDSGTPIIYLVPNQTKTYYTVTISDNPAPTQTSYTLKAVPTGAQSGNGILELTYTGVRRWDRNNDGDFLDTDETKWD